MSKLKKSQICFILLLLVEKTGDIFYRLQRRLEPFLLQIKTTLCAMRGNPFKETFHNLIVVVVVVIVVAVAVVTTTK